MRITDDDDPVPVMHPLPTASTIPESEYVRPCQTIMIEPFERTFDYQSIAKRFAALTSPLPLAGNKVLREAGGELAITRNLRALAPWCAPAIDRLDQQWRVQLWAG